MKRALGSMLGLLALASIAENKGYSDTTEYRDVLTPEQQKKKDEEALINFYKQKGLTEFNIDGRLIWARNYKNALRKSKL